MPDLLIHSMSEFSDIILDALALAEVKDIVEIGAEYGGMTTTLAEYVGERGGSLTSIDPLPKAEFLDWVAANPQVTHIGKPSLDAIGTLAAPDAWLVDGDHNWFTVFNELQGIDALSQRDGKPILAFLHDVGWPSGRRDMYYAPDAIPADHRHPCDADGGAFPGQSDLVHGRGFRGMGHFAWATHEGGPRNGVKTAVEDFIADREAQGRTIAFAEVPAVFGLGVLFDLDAPWSGALAEMLIPFHENRLIASLERNRLANYLTVLEWQDRTAAAA